MFIRLFHLFPAIKPFNSFLRNRSWKSFQKSAFPMLAPVNSVLVWEEEPDQKKKNGQRYLSLLVSFSHKEACHIVSLRRQTTEDFEVTASKIQQKLAQAISGNSKKAQISTEDEDCSVASLGPSSEKSLKSVIDDNSSLLIGGKEFPIEKEPADCLSISVPLVPVVGCPSIPALDLRTDNSEPVIHWFVQAVSTPPADPVTNGKVKKNKEKPVDIPQTIVMESENDRRFSIPGCEYRFTGKIYTPTVADVGKRLVILADPGAKSVVRCGVSKQVVSPIAEDLLCQERLDWCRENPPKPESLRLVTFNLLADLYLNLGLPQNELFFPYCPKEFQKYEYRYPLLLREIREYNADIFFLQEVDARMQMRFLAPLFETMNMEMCFEKKRKEVNEGTVIAFRKDRFRKISAESSWLAELVDEKGNEDVARVLKTSEKSDALFRARPTIVQIVMLKDVVNGRALICANTHLHHDPKHEHTKGLQALIALREVQRSRKELEASYEKVDILFGGDFNSTPDGPVFQLFTEGVMRKDDESWNLDKELVPEDLKITPEQLKYRNLTGCPEFTNYTRHPDETGAEQGFTGTLDYIFASEGVIVDRNDAPSISVDVARKHIALPSRVSPSDHISLIVDIKSQ